MRVKMKKDGTITISDFSPLQAYKIAIKMEKDGIEFYNGLLKKIKDEEVKPEIAFLIEQEEDHLRTFQGLLDMAKADFEDAFEEDDIVKYINSRVFDVSQKDELKQMEHKHTSLQEAIELERRSIVFYEGCLPHSSDKGAKDVFKKIVKEEQGHLKKFAQLLRIKCINSQKGCLL